MKDFHLLVELCQGRNVYIQTHNFPDPDAIASAFGLQRLLMRFGVDSTLCYAGRIDKLSTSRMLDAFGIQIEAYEQLCDRMREEDAIICVDSQKNAGNITDFIGDEIACIDHHPTFVRENYQYAKLCITGACASLIAAYYKELEIVPEQDVATALLYGLRMDTLRLSRGVTMLDIDMFAFLFPLSDQHKMMELERNNMELQDLKAYGAAIDSITIYERVGFVSVPFACPEGLIAALADFILALEEVTLAVVFCYREDGIKISVRSERPQVHAGHLIQRALEGTGSGGGHQEMAGGLIRADRQKELGQYPEALLRERFFAALEQTV